MGLLSMISLNLGVILANIFQEENDEQSSPLTFNDFPFWKKKKKEKKKLVKFRDRAPESIFWTNCRGKVREIEADLSPETFTPFRIEVSIAAVLISAEGLCIQW